MVDRLSITHQYANWCKGCGNEVEDDKEVIDVEEVEHIVVEEDFMKYSLDGKWPSDQQLRSKAKDVFPFCFIIIIGVC